MSSNIFRQGRLALAVTTLLGLAAAPAAQANITTSGGASFRTGSPTPTLSITAPITVNITTTGTLRYLVFDDWVTTDGTRNTASAQTNPVSVLSYQLDGVAGTSTVLSLGDNLNGLLAAMDENDGYLIFNGIAVTAGQTLVINPKSFIFSRQVSFNPNIPIAFNGDVFGANDSGVALTNTVSVSAVPEPSTWALMAAGACGLALHRQRRARRV